MTRLFVHSVLAAVSVAGTLRSQHFQVIPAAYANTDAISYEWIAGASRPLRQQTIIGESHLLPLLGRTIHAIELRRTAANEVYQGGTTSLVVELSIAPHAPLEASNQFAANMGTSPVQVFAGQVTLPTSPPAAGPAVPWSASNIVRIPLTTPFVYVGGPLCIDVVGTPVSGANADWWMADAMFEDIGGTAAELGGGCGAYGGPSHQWSNVAERTLLPGAYARFYAFGPPLSFGIAAFGARAPAPIPLSMLGFGSGPGCNLMLGSLDALMLAVFEPDPLPGLAARGGVADVRLKIPAVPAVFGVTMTTQWLEWSQMATSNAIEWTVASVIPTLDMALLEGHPTESTGELTVHLAHVVRLEWQ
jgi:hypothetical protein